jgi:hypothetical protein
MPTLEHAKLIPLDGEQAQINDAITVQFNPANLRVTLSNTLKADNRSGAASTTAQHVDKSSSTLSVELVFDTTDDSSDVRKKTQAIADKFMKPQDNGRAPKRCLFQWGRFGFRGLVTTYNETLDFFAPEGIPLRSTLSLVLTEDRFQDMQGDQSVAAHRAPALAPGGSLASAPGVSVALIEAMFSETNWQEVAQANCIENPRFPEPGILANEAASGAISNKTGGS